LEERQETFSQERVGCSGWSLWQQNPGDLLFAKQVLSGVLLRLLFFFIAE